MSKITKAELVNADNVKAAARVFTTLSNAMVALDIAAMTAAIQCRELQVTPAMLTMAGAKKAGPYGLAVYTASMVSIASSYLLEADRLAFNSKPASKDAAGLKAKALAKAKVQTRMKGLQGLLAKADPTAPGSAEVLERMKVKATKVAASRAARAGKDKPAGEGTDGKDKPAAGKDKKLPPRAAASLMLANLKSIFVANTKLSDISMSAVDDAFEQVLELLQYLPDAVEIETK